MAETFYAVKDPDAKLDYKFDWNALTNGSGPSDWLAAAETISAKTVTAETGLTVTSETITDTNTSVTVWISGGLAGQRYTLACRITTSAGRIDERTLVVEVTNR